MPRPSSRHGLLPGGRSPWKGTDAYTSQMSDYERRNQLPGLPFRGSEGRIVEGVELAANATTNVAHNLRRSYRGFIPLNVRQTPTYFRAELSANETISSSGETLIFDTVSQANSAYNTSTGIYTAPVTGRYLFHTTVSIDSSVPTSQQLQLSIDVDATRYRLQAINNGAFDSGVTLAGTLDVVLQQGAAVSVFIDLDGTEQVAGTSLPAPTFFTGALTGPELPIIDAVSTASPLSVLPLYSERAMTLDLWIY